jgi:Rod binding domain-containing protein
LPTIPPLAPVSTLPSGQPTAAAAKAGTRGAADKSSAAFRELESFVLQSFITEMLPKNASNVFGKGTAGAVWRSMLAEKLAAEIVKGGGLGIAQKIAAGAGSQGHSASLPAVIPGQEQNPVPGANLSHGAREVIGASDWSQRTSVVTDTEESGDHS